MIDRLHCSRSHSRNLFFSRLANLIEDDRKECDFVWSKSHNRQTLVQELGQLGMEASVSRCMRRRKGTRDRCQQVAVNKALKPQKFRREIECNARRGGLRTEREIGYARERDRESRGFPCYSLSTLAPPLLNTPTPKVDDNQSFKQ